MKKFAEVSANLVLLNFNCDLRSGLSAADILVSRKNHGLNKLPVSEKEHILLRYFEQFKEPLILLLLGSALLSVLVGQYEDAFSIAMAVLIVGTVGFYQEYKSEEALDALNNLVPPKCNALRSGLVCSILAEELVPGDIILLNGGDRVPADSRIISCAGLSVDESSLTGESEARKKVEDLLINIVENGDLNQYDNCVFMGTLVASGHATCVVVATGLDTQFGKTFKDLQEVESRRSPLQIKMDELGNYLSVVSMGIILCISCLGIFQGKSFLSMFNIGVSLAVAAIPEGLPICVTVTFALGVMRMARRNAIVKRLPAVEALGCANFICTDKTGTLTENKMQVESIFCPAAEEVILIQQSTENCRDHSYDDPFQNNDILTMHNLACYNQLFNCACMCNNAIYDAVENKESGSPTEIALLVCAHKHGFSDERGVCKRIKEKHFTSESKYMEVSYNHPAHDLMYSFFKGAVEVILPQCSHYYGLNGELMAITDCVRDSSMQQANKMANNGLRVLGFMEFFRGQYIFLGLFSLRDPLRKGVLESVRRIKDSGAKIMMITGDSELTAISIAQMSGILDADSSARVLSGREIEDIVSSGDNSLASIVDDLVVCYRTSPRHKLHIVRALQACGHVVAMTGDGVNDAPALKCADIGVAMGSGTDVAKEASAMVIVDDDFSTIVSAIEEGKSIFYNIKNFLTFQLSTSIAALSLVAVNNILGRPNPLNPMQILWINIIMDGPLAQSLGVEIVDTFIIKRAPRKRTEDVITKQLLSRVVTSGILVLFATLYIFFREMEDGVVSARDLTMTFTTFVTFDIFNAIACRHSQKSVFEMPWDSNRAFLAAVAFSALGQLSVIYFPPLQKVFRTEALSFMDISFIIMLGSTMLIFDTLRKKFFAKYFVEGLQFQTKVVKNVKKLGDILFKV